MSDHTQVACTGEPVSWLDLELYVLGELPGDGEQEVESHLELCEVCRDCLELIRADRSVLPQLPRLPELVHDQPRDGDSGHDHQGAWWRWLRWAVAPAAVAAAAVLLALLLPDDPTVTLPPRRVAIKGGQLALTLVRRRGEATSSQPRTFAPGDRFKVEVTCPVGQALGWDVVLFQGTEAAFPFTPSGPLSCGNREPLASAFTITGATRADVCLVVGARPLDRHVLARGPQSLPPSTVCLSLQPIP